MRVIITGGGTGGHIYPAIAIADRIRKDCDGAEILYVGAPNSLEEKIAKKYNYEFKAVEVKGFQRKLSLENIKRFLLAAKALKKSRKIIKKFKPDLVIGTGGYVAGPVVYAGQQAKITSMIHEQNAYPGITNKLLSKKASKIYLGFEAAREKFNTDSPIETVGNPVRADILNAKTREEARKELGIDMDQRFILISGGSSGSERMNQVFLDLIEDFVEKDIGFILSTGAIHYKKIIKGLDKNIDSKKFMVVDYIDDMSNYIAASDLCIISAGATTIAEVNAIGRASIVIPKAYSAENHQVENAKNIEDKGAGFYIKENDLTPGILLEKTLQIMEDKTLKDKMEKASQTLYPKDPCEAIIRDIKDYMS